VGVLRSAAHRRVEFRLPVWLRGVFIIAVHHTFVLGLGARHGGIVKLSVVRCVTVFACFTYLLTYLPLLNLELMPRCPYGIACSVQSTR